MTPQYHIFTAILKLGLWMGLEIFEHSEIGVCAFLSMCINLFEMRIQSFQKILKENPNPRKVKEKLRPNKWN